MAKSKKVELLLAALAICVTLIYVSRIRNGMSTDQTSDVDTNLGMTVQNPVEEQSAVTEIPQEVLATARAEVADTISNNTTYQQLLPEQGGSPIVALLISYWRSGSSFTGKLLQSHPAIFYHYEPLRHMRQIIRTEGMASATAIKLLEDLARCQYNGITPHYMEKFNLLSKHASLLLRRLCDMMEKTTVQTQTS